MEYACTIKRPKAHHNHWLVKSIRSLFNMLKELEISGGQVCVAIIEKDMLQIRDVL